MDNLLDLFADEDQEADLSTTNHPGINIDNVSMSMLTKDARAIARGIIGEAESKKGLLDRACPNWKENVSFALKQTDPRAIDQALENVRLSRQRMIRQKQEILSAWERQNAALEVFETALQASAELSTTKHESDQCDGFGVQEEELGGFLTQQGNVNDDEDYDDEMLETGIYD